jgi:hypothetical protein
MPRDPRAEKVVRLRRERRMRAARRLYGTQTPAYGGIRAGARQRDTGRIGLALVLLVGLTSVLLYVLRQAEIAPWLHMVLHAVGLGHGGPLPAPLR